MLDQALLRPGRFDRRVLVQRPDRAGRAAILKVHTKNVPLAPDVSLERIAAATPGLVGAELRNLVNEAALLAARKDANMVGAEDFGEAMQKITLGPARHILLTPADRERTAYHEAGHALLALVVPAATRFTACQSCRAAWRWERRINSPPTIVRATPRTTCGRESPARWAAAPARKARLRSGDDRRRNDLQQVTEIARRMVLRWGMSEKLGPISFVAPQDEGLPPAFQHQPYSEATSELIDAEVRHIVEQCHSEADRLLAEHRDKLEALAQALLKAESLNEKEIWEVTGLTEPFGQEEGTSARLQAGKR